LAAIEATASAVQRIPGCSNFTLKELIRSKQVNDQFAFLVSASYLNSGDALPPSRSEGGKGRNNTYLNINRLRQVLADKIYTANIWFEQVRKRSNSQLKEFDIQARDELASIRNAEEREERKQELEKLRSKLPQYELVYSEY
jgi:hypothetical protein